jgi:hypothetical protein
MADQHLIGFNRRQNMNRTAIIALLAASALFSIARAQTGREGVWENVTPPDCNMSGSYSGVMFVATDPVRPQDAYFQCDARGVWKSTDYGLTWKKASGTNSDKVGSGRSWGSATDRNPNRSASTPFTIFLNQGYGVGGIWKSNDGGNNWAQVWNNNIYETDGTTNISCDVGSDILWIVTPDPADINHIVTCLHSYHNGYPGCGTVNHNGLFESFDGGGKWTFKQVPFAFDAHGDVFRAIDKNTWLISHGQTGNPIDLWRSTDAGATWKQVSPLGIGCISICRSGSAIYATGNGLFKSTDNGATWVQLSNAKTSTVVATATRVYTSWCPGWAGDPPAFRHASLAKDNVWTDDPAPSNAQGGFSADVTYNGKNYVILNANWQAGVWRYVEPAPMTGISTGGAAHKTNSKAARLKISISAGSMGSSGVNAGFHDLTGKKLSKVTPKYLAVVVKPE